MTRINRGIHALRVAAGSVAFYIGLTLMTPPFALAVLLLWPFPLGAREATARLWCRTVLMWLRVTCGIRHEVAGLEHLPDTRAVILSKHQSAWETIAFRTMFPARLSWVIKRSLFAIPFYGWALRALEEIGIDRSAGREALRQLMSEGQRHLQAGRWVVIFPEGTRVAPGESGSYATGGARLACKAGVPVVPVALNSGECWPKIGWLKYPGTIRVEIGPAIDASSRSANEVNELARQWIEAAAGKCTAATDSRCGPDPDAEPQSPRA